MRAPEPGEAAIRLPWLPPGLSSLVALARHDSPQTWEAIRHDPGAVLLLLRHVRPGSSPELPHSIFRDPAVLASALRYIEETGFREPDWQRPDIAAVYQSAIDYAVRAEQIARRIGGCDPVCAWTAGLLAPLGWLAVVGSDPTAAADVFREPVYADRFADVQRDLWGLDTPAIARRLVRRWRLPDWLRAITGHLNLPAELAATLGADERLFRLTQLAVHLGQDAGHHLGLEVDGDIPALSASLGLNDADIEQLQRICRESPTPVWCPSPVTAADLLPDLLAVAIQKRQRDDGATGERVEEEVDRLHEALAAQRAGEAERLHRAKLRSLAEFAAGAGHEINNPLAVISGHAQYLLNREGDESRQTSLHGIIRQTERIHQILRDLMQFARPPQPRRQAIDLRHIVRDVVTRLTPTTPDAPRLEWHDPGEPRLANSDPLMASAALTCLIRNALEATPLNGWIRIMIDRQDENWAIIVEDSGPGPSETRREHLFDPFYSGRNAGRGRGMGLPTAWRLAHENGGDVRFEPRPGQPTRFTLTLPVCPPGTTPHGPPTDARRRTA